MSWLKQAGDFTKDLHAAQSKVKQKDDKKVDKLEMEFVSSASEARLLAAPEGAAFLIMLCFVLTVVMLAGAFYFKIDETVKGMGKVVPTKQIQAIQNLEGGILKDMNVSEGQKVKKGDIVAVLDDTEVVSSYTEQKNSYIKLLARIQRLDSEVHDKDKVEFDTRLADYPTVREHEVQLFNSSRESMKHKLQQLDFEIEQAQAELQSARENFLILKENYHVSEEQFRVNESAFKKHAISKSEYIKEKQRINELKASLKKTELEIPKLRATFHSLEQKKETAQTNYRAELFKEREEIELKLEQFQARTTEKKSALMRSTIEAPETGTIKKIYINTLGGVIKPGMVIMDLVPSDDELLIEAKIQPRDIGFIHKGLPCKVKFTAFDFSKYGGLEGIVDFVSADSITDDKGNSFFIVRVKTDKNYINDKKGGHLEIIPGIQAEVDIIVGKKSILEYIMKPMIKF
jgi:adhesin transport system membrane fusion protein